MNNIKGVRKNKGMTQVEVAKELGITQSQYSRYESGFTNIPSDMLSKIADLFGVSVDVILGRDGDETQEPIGRRIVIKPELAPEDEVMIPLVASLHCGYGKAGEPFSIIKQIPVPQSYITRWGKHIAALEAVGKSMLPTIRPGDLMICIPGEAWEDGNIVDIDVNDSDTIKRIYRAADGGIDLVPDNEDFETMHYSPADLDIYRVHVLARVVKTIGPDL